MTTVVAVPKTKVVTAPNTVERAPAVVTITPVPVATKAISASAPSATAPVVAAATLSTFPSQPAAIAAKPKTVTTNPAYGKANHVNYN